MTNCPHCQRPVDCTGITGRVACPYCKKQFDCTPAQPTPEPADFSDDPMSFSTPISSYRKASGAGSSSAGLSGVFDPSFDRFVTPSLVKVIWVLLMVLAAIFALLVLVGGVAGAAKNQLALIMSLLSVAGIFLWLLWARMALEAMIVLFKISDTLSSIDRKTKGQ